MNDLINEGVELAHRKRGPAFKYRILGLVSLLSVFQQGIMYSIFFLFKRPQLKCSVQSSDGQAIQVENCEWEFACFDESVTNFAIDYQSEETIVNLIRNQDQICLSDYQKSLFATSVMIGASVFSVFVLSLLDFYQRK
jgi:hypothetical protein